MPNNLSENVLSKRLGDSCEPTLRGVWGKGWNERHGTDRRWYTNDILKNILRDLGRLRWLEERDLYTPESSL